MKRIFRIAGAVILALVAVCGALCACAKWQAYQARKDAEILVSAMHSLRIGESTTHDVSKIASSHNRYRVYLAEDRRNCSDTDDACYFDFLYQNSLLALLRIAPQTEFGARIQVVRGRVDVVLMSIACGSGSGFVSTSIMDGAPKELISPDSFHVSFASNWRGAVLIKMTRDVPKSVRDRAYSVGLTCLDRIGGCHGKTELLPAMADEVAAAGGPGF